MGGLFGFYDVSRGKISVEEGFCQVFCKKDLVVCERKANFAIDFTSYHNKAICRRMKFLWALFGEPYFFAACSRSCAEESL